MAHAATHLTEPPGVGDDQPADLTLPRTLILRNGSEFDAVFASGKRYSSRHFAIHVRENGLDHPRLGLAIARRRVRLANRRNRIKRLVRESFRHRRHHLPAVDSVVVARSGVDRYTNQQLTGSIGALWEAIIAR